MAQGADYGSLWAGAAVPSSILLEETCVQIQRRGRDSKAKKRAFQALSY